MTLVIVWLCSILY